MFVEKKKKKLKKMMNKKNKKTKKKYNNILLSYSFLLKKVTFYLPMKERENRTRLKILFIKIDVE